MCSTLKSGKRGNYHKKELFMKGSFKMVENMVSESSFLIKNFLMLNTRATGRRISMMA